MGRQPASTSKTSQRKPAAEDAGAAARREIVAQLKGPVADRLKSLVPQLAAVDDVYRTVMESPELLAACLLLFRKQRNHFADFLVDAAGQPVADDAAKLRCGRNVHEIVGMIVRSGARAYAQKRFGDPKPAKPHVVHPETQGLLRKLRELISGKWGQDESVKPKPGGRPRADLFYDAIKDNLDYEWQVPLIPHYAELPPKLIAELGRGLTTLRTPDGIAALANIGRHSMDEARKILSDDMMREMLDTQPLAAQGVAFLGKAKYEFMHEAVYGKMGAKFWEMCKDTGRLEAMEDKNAKDLEEMAEFLHVIGPDTINRMIDKLQIYQLAIFLETAWKSLGADKFAAIFGSPGKPALIRTFTEKAAAFKLEAADPAGDFASRLPDIFKAYLLHPQGYDRGL